MFKIMFLLIFMKELLYYYHFIILIFGSTVKAPNTVPLGECKIARYWGRGIRGAGIGGFCT